MASWQKYLCTEHLVAPSSYTKVDISHITVLFSMGPLTLITVKTPSDLFNTKSNRTLLKSVNECSPFLNTYHLKMGGTEPLHHCTTRADARIPNLTLQYMSIFYVFCFPALCPTFKENKINAIQDCLYM